MTYTDSHPTSQRGATRERRRTYSAEALLKSLMDTVANPHDWSVRNDIKSDITATLHGEEGRHYIDTVIDGWFQNAYKRLLADYPNPNGGTPSSREQQAEAVKTKQAEIEQTIEKAIDKRVKLKLLDLVLPNGKALRACTGSECRRMGKKIGPWLTTIADRVGPKRLVGAVMTENAVRRIYPK